LHAAPPLPRSFPTRRSSDLRSCPQESRANLRGGIATPQGVRVRRSHPAVAPPPAPAVPYDIRTRQPAQRKIEWTPSWNGGSASRSEEHTSELQSRENLVCRP